MRTTLVIADGVMRRLKEEAARQSRTMSDLVEEALRALLEPEIARDEPPPLPVYRCGGHLVAIDDREALYDRMEGTGGEGDRDVRR